MYEENNIRNLVNHLFRDPITAILLKNSNLTTVQYESLVIDYLSDIMTDNEPTYCNKALLRSKKVSRGSYRRTLSQARRNIISAIYTILLLIYIGIFDTTPFDEYKNLADKLREYLDFVQGSDETQAKRVLQRIEKELMDGIRGLTETRRLKTA